VNWRDAYPVVETSAAVMVNATDQVPDHGLSIWDSVVLAASADAGCRLLLSEDIQERFTWRGVTLGVTEGLNRLAARGRSRPGSATQAKGV